MTHYIVLIEGNLIRTWRESIRVKNKSLLFRRGRVWNVDDKAESYVILFRESRVEQRLHWCGHFFNYRLKRMRSSGGKRHFTFNKGGEVGRRLRRWNHRDDQGRSVVKRNHICLRISRALR